MTNGIIKGLITNSNTSWVLFAIFQSHFSHSCFGELQNLKKTYNFLQQSKTSFDGYFVFFSLSFPPVAFIFLTCPPSFN